MMRLKWRDSATAVARPRIRVERFLGKKKHRVHLLADPQCHQVHYKHEENTVGCLAPDPCPKCGPSAGWKTRLEHYAPALVQDEKVKLWVPIVAVLTAGGYKDLAKCPAGAMRGRMLEISRLRKGPVNQMKIRELTRVDPIIPAFDPEPYVVALWWPELAEQLPPDGYVPDPIPYVDEPAPVVLQPEAKPISAEERARVRELFDKTRANGYSLTAPPAAVVEPAEMPPGRRAAQDAPPAAPPASADDTVVDPPPAPAKGPTLGAATDHELRVEAIKRAYGLNGTKPKPPAELAEVLAQIPAIKRHPDGTFTGPATVPMNGHARNGKPAGKGGVK